MSFWVRPNSPERRSSSYHSSSQHHAPASSHGHESHEKHEKSEKPQYYFSRPAASSHSGSRSHSYSSSRARPRDGYVNRILYKIKRYLRRLYEYARRNPMKLFMLVIMPLISGGALAEILRRFGIRLPPALERLIPGVNGGGRDGRGGGYVGGGNGESIDGVMKLAKMFI